jgi:phospholipase/carboxylesterase
MDLLHTAHVPAGDGPFPTIVALHGWGASAHDLFGLAPLLHGGEAVVLCPQGPVEVPIGPGMTGHGWFPLEPGKPPDPEEFRKGARALREFFAEARERYPIDPSRVVLLGFSQGGAMAYEWALSEPESVAGLIALATWLPEPLASAVGNRPGQADLPVLVLHGTQDAMVSVDMARASRERLRDFGVRLMYRELEMGHEVSREALELIVRWLEDRPGRSS